MFTAPSSKYGFQFVMSCNPQSTAELRYGGITDFDFGSDCSGTYQPGAYLVGIQRTGMMSNEQDYVFFTQLTQ